MKSENELLSGSQGRFTGRHMFAIMVAFFGVIITVNFTMAWFASNSWTGLVVPNSYVASQQFNEELAAAREQNERGWRSAVAYRENLVSVQLVDERGEPVLLDQLQAIAGRPATEINDHALVFEYAGSGIWNAQANLEPGLWKLDISGNKADQAYRLDARMYVSHSGEGRLQ